MRNRYRTLAITGGTGFVGRHLIDAALAQGHLVRALTRSPRPPRDGVQWIYGSLEKPLALTQLVAGADAVIHVAGTISAPDRAGFALGNVEGTLAMVNATRAAGIRRFVHVSSLAAREPKLSHYGWSKARSEIIVAASALDWTIVRPPAVFGPGDREMLELFRAARRGIVPLPPGGNLSVIAAQDLVRLLLAVLPDGEDSHAAIYEPDDGRPGGWTHAEFAQAIGHAVGRRVRPQPVPAWAMRAGAKIDALLRGPNAKLTEDRVRYFLHDDWVVNPDFRPPAHLWRPQLATVDGLAIAAESYREEGLLA
ncbi:NAD-dependent epimerase/dehydratase family protein [Sphingomonas sp. PR090111-T3T-6A]|uniref:NAD-dependent epimerase/dehydratase family protein n=1 Tax=Sphingomonas sp. PR090111-T3T-6A TaxID=685778 RepID=UPI00035EDCFF|nr:NAD(P)H-binding protein [Sphingomonas sp. PR090111-T3T-6A]